MNARTDIPLGLIKSMPAAVYHSIHAMSAGGLKRMAQSPAHFYGMQLDPNRPPAGEPTPALINGTLVHCALFEPTEVAERYVVKPEGHDGRTKAGKEWNAANADRICIEAAQLAAAQAQAAAVRALPDLAALLSEGYGESSAFWIDDQTGELCKCRPDWVSPAGDGVILVDGKTCRLASPEGFARSIWDYDYHLQASWYCDGFELATGLKVHGFVFAAVESAWPHLAAAYMLPDDVMDMGRAKNRQLLNLYAACKRSGEWPGYPQTIQQIQLPSWAMKELSE